MMQLYKLRIRDWLMKILEKYPKRIQPSLAIFFSLPYQFPDDILIQILTHVYDHEMSPEEQTGAATPRGSISRTLLDWTADLRDDWNSHGISNKLISGIMRKEIFSERYALREQDYATLAIHTLHVAFSLSASNLEDYFACVRLLSKTLLPKAGMTETLATLLQDCWLNPYLPPWGQSEILLPYSRVPVTRPKVRGYGDSGTRCIATCILANAACNYIQVFIIGGSILSNLFTDECPIFYHRVLVYPSMYTVTTPPPTKHASFALGRAVLRVRNVTYSLGGLATATREAKENTTKSEGFWMLWGYFQQV